MSQAEQQPWWHDIPMQAGGDIITAQIGAGASDVAVGKNITQAVYSTLGPPEPDDKQVIEQKLNELSAAVQKLAGPNDPNKATMAEFQVKLLRGELTKTGKDEKPSAVTITQIGDWLLDQVPGIADLLVSMFATPPVGRVVGKAGERAIKWLRMRFGNQAAPPAPQTI
jgi:hypothetical protein